jgi:hypothetical protein
MSFTGGKIPLIGVSLGNILSTAGNVGAAAIPPTSVSNAVTASAVTRIIPGALEVGLSAALGSQLSSELGLNLTTSRQALASGISGFTSATVQGLVNTEITNSLANAGPVGAALTPLANQIANNLINNATNGVLQGLGLGNAFSGNQSNTGASRAYPGAGNEPEADYGGSVYSLGPNGGDVVFSISPVTSGPAAFGDPLNGFPTISTKMPFTSVGGNGGTSVYGSKYDLSNISKLKSINADTSNTFGPVDVDTSYWKPESMSVSDNGISVFDSINASKLQSSTGWTFICAPESVEWNTNAAVDRVPIFGTNKPPVVVGTKGMRDLSMGNALVEGFMRSKTVESKIQALETLFQYTQGKGFVNIPIFQVTANSKKYGGSDGGYFVMNELRVKEVMRDLRGEATRAYVDVSFIQVPEYQVGSGRDQASTTSSAAVGALQKSNSIAQQAGQARNVGSSTPRPSGGAGGITGEGGAAGGAGSSAPDGGTGQSVAEAACAKRPDLCKFIRGR